MNIPDLSLLAVESFEISSVYLSRKVRIDCRLPFLQPGEAPGLLLINDGQMLEEAGFDRALSSFGRKNKDASLLCVGIHAGKERLQEYGAIGSPDYLKRGSRAGAYAAFIFEELIPWLRDHFRIHSFREKSFAGFSLGGLSAFDLVWNYPAEFSRVGVFSGSFWWRMYGLDHPEYDDSLHRIIHREVRKGAYYPWLSFFFECGTEDETADRNNNGIIDSIDDTLDLLDELRKKGYAQSSLYYLELEGGRHDAATWGKAWPAFLEWGWGPSR